MKRLILFSALLFSTLCVTIAQTSPEWYPKVDDAAATFVNSQGDEEQVEIGNSYDAPFTVTFSANPIDTIGYDVLYEWKIEQVKNGVPKLLVMRNEENTTYTFTEGGVEVNYSITLAITYRHRETGLEGEGGAEPITFSLRGSSLELYNAFSPNGDGTNDLFRVKTQSLLSFRMKIFNRWGQEIVSGDQNSLPTEHEGDYTYYVCWDGTYHGRLVEDGVYFILVEAQGSDGIQYVRRGDINILTRLTKEEKQ